ncbi:MAG: OB-fold nucleic acid binding domain-containing protein, partial [Ferruginibacter sp.]
GHPKEKLEKIWTDWEAFAEYAFNKSHSTCYAFIAYQTAYLKAHYPSEFMAAVLNHAGGIEKITFFMEECKRMGLKVLGPDINESNNGFAVNKKGEIRFGFSGLKGVGENAIENIIEERNKQGVFKDIFDLVKRVNLRSVNKKSLESLIYSGAFDCFKELHRAQYFFTPSGDITSLEKILKFGSVFQAQSANTANTLFGDLQMPDIVSPKLPNCAAWQLIEQLNFEKDVTGMYMSGHPLDNFRFELDHYNITPIADFLEIKNTMDVVPLGITFRLAGLVIDGQHRLTKNGKNYGVLYIEDFTGKTDFFLFQESYARYQHYFEKGMSIMVEGAFKEQRFKPGEYEFGITKMHLLETAKTSLTKQLIIDIMPEFIDDVFIDFIDTNIKKNPGKASIRFNIMDTLTNQKISLYSIDNGFNMNDDLAVFLNENKYFRVNVLTP